MLKKSLSIVSALLVVCMLLQISALAAPGSLSEGDSGNSNSLIWIRRPSSLSATTSERTYTVTAAGRPGVDVTIYRKSYLDGQFYRVYQGGYLLSGTIGASGVYIVSINLLEGGNRIKIYAENDWERQIITIDITRLTKSQLDKINGLSVGDMFAY